MHPDILLLAERLVLAVETMSHDVKNMSAYVYDLSCSVSHLLNEQRQKECISYAGCNEGDDHASVTSKAGQENFPKGEFSAQCKEADVGSSSHIDDPEHGEISLGYIAPMSINPHEISDVLSSESNLINSEDIKSETQSVTEEDDQAFSLPSTISHSVEQQGPPDLLENMELASSHVGQEVQCVMTSSNLAVNCAGTAFVSRLPEADTSFARTQQVMTANDAPVLHTRVHIKEGCYKCSFCAKSFCTLGNLQIHMRMHTGERPFKCNVCGNAFTQNCHLTQHMRLHTGERPYKCTVCGKAFSDKSILRHHMLTHTGEKPHRCDVCGKVFRQKSNLTVHMRSHTDERPYMCNVCGKTFRYTKNLNHHMRTHYGQHPN